MRRRASAVDDTMVQVVRLVLEDGWDVHDAAARLRGQADEAVLRRVQARVLRALEERPSPIAERASATLHLALGPTGTPAGPGQAGRNPPAAHSAESVR